MESLHLLTHAISENPMGQNEKREGTRQAITRIAHIATGVSPPLECQMKDVSEHGARIVVGDPRSAPQEFLILLSDDLLRWCQVIWRSDTEIGIKFVTPPQSLKSKKAKAEPT